MTTAVTRERAHRHQPAHLDHRRPARGRRRDAASRPASPRRAPRASRASSSAASSRARRPSSRLRSRRTASPSSRAGTARTCSCATRLRNSRRCARTANCCRRSAATWSWSRRRRAASMASAARDSRSGRCSLPPDWPRFAERLDELGERLQDAGLALAYHHHMGTVVQTEDEVDRLMDSCDDAGLAPARHGPPDFRRRRPGARRDPPCRAHRARALQGCAPRRAGSAASTATRASSMPCSTASSRCPATAAWITRRARADRARGLPRLARRRGRTGSGSRALRRLRRPGLPQPAPPRGRPGLRVTLRFGRRGFVGSRARRSAPAPDSGRFGRTHRAIPRLMEGPMIGATTARCGHVLGPRERGIRRSRRVLDRPATSRTPCRVRRCAPEPRTTTRCASP